MADNATLAASSKDPAVQKRYRNTLTFDSSALQKRDGYHHFDSAQRHAAAKSSSAKDDITRATGAKETILNLLPYWDSTRMVVSDVMHGAWLGDCLP